jgi:hypothetical protein
MTVTRFTGVNKLASLLLTVHRKNVSVKRFLDEDVA